MVHQSFAGQHTILETFWFSQVCTFHCNNLLLTSSGTDCCSGWTYSLKLQGPWSFNSISLFSCSGFYSQFDGTNTICISFWKLLGGHIFQLECWPLEHVMENSTDQCLTTVLTVFCALSWYNINVSHLLLTFICETICWIWFLFLE